MGVRLRSQGQVGGNNRRSDWLYMLLFESTLESSKIPKVHELTSSSETIIATSRPLLGNTCARSPSFTVSLLPLLIWTRRLSRASVPSLPPIRSFESSSLSRATAVAIPCCNWERSNESVDFRSGADELTPGSVELLLPRSFFLSNNGVLKKLRNGLDTGPLCWINARRGCIAGKL